MQRTKFPIHEPSSLLAIAAALIRNPLQQQAQQGTDIMFFDSDSSSDEEQDTQTQRAAHHRQFLVLRHAKKQRKRPSFGSKLALEGRRRRSRGLTRDVLLNPENSPWAKLYKSQNDQAFLITVTGFDHEAFDCLLNYFEPIFEQFTPWTGQTDGKTYTLLHQKKKGRLQYTHFEPLTLLAFQ